MIKYFSVDSNSSVDSISIAKVLISIVFLTPIPYQAAFAKYSCILELLHVYQYLYIARFIPRSLKGYDYD